MNPSKKAYIETFGCQMNERDSEIMGQMLANVDYSPTRDIKQADVIVINTCSIREKAEQKVYSLLGRIRKLKEEKPSLIISVAGCVAQQEGERLQARMEHVDIVIGPQHIYKL
ncbi:MAG: tRNA (N6-isopentenyl adenosine(37)-C2)-methylthiotransferase MiaB, partial [Desulfobulbaceae bacterium]|nr:tRNA (N6-isopentenyl adenosine(37)-C2)-methylthiotransferase MiaB [Desulfobulbaceae bacterium]